MIPPPNHDERDVYILTKKSVAPKKPTNDRVDFNDVMVSALPAWNLDMTELPVENTSKTTSLLPVAIPSTAPAAIPTAPTTNARALYAALIGALSATAVVLAIWNVDGRAVQPVAAAAGEAPATVVDLPLVQVEGTVETAAAAVETKPAAETAVVAPQAAARGGSHQASEGASPAVVAPTSVESKTTDTTALPTPAPAEEELGPFDKNSASAGLTSAGNSASGCREAGDPSATVGITVTFAPSGRVTNAVVDGPPFGGTKTGGCIAKLFRAVRVSPFSGSAVTVHKSFQVR